MLQSETTKHVTDQRFLYKFFGYARLRKQTINYVLPKSFLWINCPLRNIYNSAADLSEIHSVSI